METAQQPPAMTEKEKTKGEEGPQEEILRVRCATV